MKQDIRVILSSDDHLSNKNPKFRMDSKGVSELLVRQHKLSQFIADKLKTDFDLYINGGDLTDYANLDPVTSTITNKYIKNIIDTGKPCIFLEGNHCISDTKNAFTVLGAISSLTDCSNVRFVFQDEILKLDKNFNFTDSDEDSVLVVYCFPYFSDLKALAKRIELASSSTDKSKFNLMIFHFPCSNAFLDNGMTATRGLELSEAITEGFDLCLGGDYHKHQKLINNSKSFYIGAPFDLKHGEHYDRHILSARLNTKSKKYSIDKIPNPHLLPIVDLTCSEALSMSREEALNNIVRIKDEVDTQNKIKLESMGFHKLSIVNYKPPKNNIVKTIDNVRVIKSSFSSSDRDLLREYIANKYETENEVNEVVDFFERNRL